jgi:CRISPR-associated protein Cst2
MSLKSLSLVARVVMDLHALNNEGNESNRLMTRQVGIVTPTSFQNEDGTLTEGYQRSVVNAISGDMNKHIFADAFHNIAAELGLPLCEACRALDPSRMMGNAEFRQYIETKPPVDEVINRLLTCAPDDVCGIMITGAGTSVKRKSAIEFGWTVGLPGVTEVQEFIHARHAVTRLTRTKADKNSDEAQRQQAQKEKEQNIGQMIFNRPAASGVYAFVSHLDVGAIGFNDAAQTYPLDDDQRNTRLRAALLALTQTLLHPKGALTSTQLPHVVDLEGYVSVSQSAAAAPLISPLHAEYQARAAQVAEKTNQLYGQNAIALYPFQGAHELLGQFEAVLNSFAAGKYRE